MKLIAFCGPKQSGKSTVAAAHLITNHGWQHRGFANALKIMLDAIGVPYECLYGDRKEEPLEMLSGRSARYAMQTLGEKWGRQGMHSDFWLNLWKAPCSRFSGEDRGRRSAVPKRACRHQEFGRHRHPCEASGLRTLG